MEAIIAAVLTAALAAASSITVGVINNKSQYNKIIAEITKNGELHAYRLEQLEQKVDKHNKVIERTYHLEEAEAVLKEQIKVANHRIEDLEKAEKRGST